MTQQDQARKNTEIALKLLSFYVGKSGSGCKIFKIAPSSPSFGQAVKQLAGSIGVVPETLRQLLLALMGKGSPSSDTNNDEWGNIALKIIDRHIRTSKMSIGEQSRRLGALAFETGIIKIELSLFFLQRYNYLQSKALLNGRK